ncbi:MAG: 1-acyl-sn-glycerol-3-phosphate acyltransferase [Bacteroidales bacterium]|nr:1-acyl-sn-glycerol-3-phosphate acyltransferase [Bacteroidales bacterium]
MVKAIQDNVRLYNLLSPLVKFATRCHYNRFVIRGTEYLPTDGAYIIAPCHQQALMEPLAVLCFAPKPPVFLARADIFRKPTIRAILTFLKILPVYRIRDGQENLGKNKEIFDQSRDVLLDGYPLCLMAEGRHNNRHHLLNMGKGMFRIAGETQRILGSTPLFIVPTGIDFDEYERPYSNLVVNIGKPIPVHPFMETYCNNEPLALNQMRDTIFEALMPLMHDIRNEEHYDEIMTLCNVLNRTMRRREGLRNTVWNRFRMRQQIARKMDSLATETDNTTFASMISDSRLLREQCNLLHLNEKLISEHWSLGGTLLSLLPLAALLAVAIMVPAVRWVLLFCLLCYPLPLLPIQLIVRKVIADTQFRSSFDFGIRLVLSILYALTIGIVMACNGGAWMSRLADIGAWWGLVSVAVVFLDAYLAGPAINLIRDIFANCRYWLLRLFKHRSMRQLIDTIAKLDTYTL